MTFALSTVASPVTALLSVPTSRNELSKSVSIKNSRKSIKTELATVFVTQRLFSKLRMHAAYFCLFPVFNIQNDKSHLLPPISRRKAHVMRCYLHFQSVTSKNSRYY